jgi:hypothetical protein
MCPGRFSAKRLATFVLATLSSEYDIESLTDSITYTTERFGMAIELPTEKIPFRIRKRSAQ